MFIPHRRASTMARWGIHPSPNNAHRPISQKRYLHNCLSINWGRVSILGIIGDADREKVQRFANKRTNFLTSYMKSIISGLLFKQFGQSSRFVPRHAVLINRCSHLLEEMIELFMTFRAAIFREQRPERFTPCHEMVKDIGPLLRFVL